MNHMTYTLYVLYICFGLDNLLLSCHISCCNWKAVRLGVKTGSPQVLLGGPGGQGTRVEVSPDTSRA